MNIQFFVTIFLSTWTLIISQDFKDSPLPKPQKRHSPILSLMKLTRSKLVPIKRSPLLSSKPAPRIVNKTPLNLLQNGPYYINHYIYCDNIDKHTMDQIKAGTISSNKEIQLLNLHKDEYHNIGGFIGNKEFHVLHLPKDKKPDLEDVKLHLSLLNAHESSNAPEIDLDLNKHLGDFEVNFEDIKPVNLDSSHLPTTITIPANELVRPLFQGHISSGQNHKHNGNLLQLADYLNGNGHNEKGFISQQFGTFESHETNKYEGVLDLPHFEKHPLEHDPSKSSYDTPGAIDSYGQPATQSYSPQFPYSKFGTETSQNTFGQLNSAHFIPNKHYGVGSFSNGVQNSGNIFNQGFDNGLKGNDLYQPEDYINQLNEINGLQRIRRMDVYKSSTTTDKSSTEKLRSSEEVKHANHKYD